MHLVHIPDLREDEAYMVGEPIRVASVDRLGMRSWLGVPLLKEDELLGAFTLYRTEVQPFSNKQIAFHKLCGSSGHCDQQRPPVRRGAGADKRAGGIASAADSDR